MGRIDYYHDPDAPRANSLVVGSSAIVVDDRNRILLQRRTDSGNWALPGGAMDIGETFAESAVREVKEETGFDVRHLPRMRHHGGSLHVSSESTAVEFFTFEEAAGLQMHESIRKRVRDYLDNAPPVLR